MRLQSPIVFRSPFKPEKLKKYLVCTIQTSWVDTNNDDADAGFTSYFLYMDLKGNRSYKIRGLDSPGLLKKDSMHTTKIPAWLDGSNSAIPDTHSKVKWEENLPLEILAFMDRLPK